MTYTYYNNPDSTDESAVSERLLDEMEPGDCLVVERFSAAARTTKGFLSLMAELADREIRFRSLEEDFDTADEQGLYTLSILAKIAGLDDSYRRERQREGIHNAKEDGKYKGRRPIEVDESTFDAIFQRWKNGEITARQAMNELGLKTNTFYRRVKERMNETESGEAILQAAKKLGKDVAAGAEELGHAAEKLANECDPNAVMETIGKNFSMAGKVLEGLSRDIHHTFERYTQEPASGAEDIPVEGEIVTEPVAEAEAAENEQSLPLEG